MSDKLPINVNNRRLISRDEVRGVDAWAINEMGVPGVVLMENAGRGCADIVHDRLVDGGKVCIFCGGGNNGGDGYVIARHLYNSGIDVRVILCCDRQKISGDALVNLEIIEKMELDIVLLVLKGGGVEGKINELSNGCAIIVDALFGTGLSGVLRDEYIKLIDNINSAGKEVIAVDIPSGLDCDKGVPLGTAIKAAATVTFVAVKKGFVCEGADEYTGDVYVASIGIDKIDD